MNLKTLAVILVVLLGGMVIYYNQAVSNNVHGDAAPQLEKAK